MINRIIGFSIAQRVHLFVLLAAACAWGAWSMLHLPLDATPDLGETQVIILSRWDRSPDIIEDQVTFPIISALTGAPHVRTVRGISDFGYSYVYVIFDEGTDVYWARSRAMEYLAPVRDRLPSGVKTEVGPDASGLGWIYQYVLRDESGRHNSAELRSYQDWYLAYHLKSVPGVAEVASIGGFTQQYQVNVDPNRLRQFGIPMSRVVSAVQQSNQETGARLLESGGAEYMIRGRGYLRSVQDLEESVLSSSGGTPIRIKDVGRVVLGPEIRRGAADLNGAGEVVSGIVIMREGSNALDVIHGVKRKIQDVTPGLSPGIRIEAVYDRSELIDRAISSTSRTLIEVIVTVVIVIVIFLWHFPSAIIPVITIPVTVLITFIPLRFMGVSINVMSLAGIALACGAMVDAAIVVVEQTQKKLEARGHFGRDFSRRDVVLEAVKEVAAPTFFALLVISVSFVPVLVLEGQEGKLLRPLVYTKTFAMLIAALLAITLDPALRLLLARNGNQLRGGWFHQLLHKLLDARSPSEENHPITGPLMRLYEPVVRWTLRRKAIVIACSVLLVVATVPLFWKLGSEFMPPLDEGALLYMPSTMPGISIGQSEDVLRTTDRILKQFPEVDHVFGKVGRADTATDPAPLSMMETVVVLKPTSEWPKRKTWYSSWAPGFLATILRRITSDHISQQELVAKMDEALQIPGLSNSWTMPIRGRIEMLSTGIRTPLGLKIQGDDVQKIQAIGLEAEQILSSIPGTRSVFAERAADGFFLDITWDRKMLARYGLSVEDAQAAMSAAVGGDNVTTVIDGRMRHPVNVRYQRDFRSSLDAIGHVLVPASGEQQVPLKELATVRTLTGPAMIRNENGLRTGYVFVDPGDQPSADWVEIAKRHLRERLQLPPGYSLNWSGEYESTQRVKQRLLWIAPLTVGLILYLIGVNTRSFAKTAIIVLAVPFSAVGALWMTYLIGYNLSIAVWVGVIALLGVDAETGVFMLLYLDLAYEKAKKESAILSTARLHEAIVDGAAKRLRPKLMTFVAIIAGLFPILWSSGTGSEIMKRIAAPMVGGICTSFILELMVYPAIYAAWRTRSIRREMQLISTDMQRLIESEMDEGGRGRAIAEWQPASRAAD